MNTLVAPYEGKKVTVYYGGGFGYHKMEVKTLSVERRKYAQYDNAIHVTYREPRKRKDSGFVKTRSPRLVVLDGWGHSLDPAKEAHEPVVVSESDNCVVTTSKTRFSCFAPEYDALFDDMLKAYVAETGATVLRDYREANVYGSEAA